MHDADMLRTILDGVRAIHVRLDGLEQSVRRVSFRLAVQDHQEKVMLTTVIAEVQETKTAVAGIIAFNKGLKAKIEELFANAATLEQVKADAATLVAEMDSMQNDIAAAVATTPEGDEVEIGDVPVVA